MRVKIIHIKELTDSLKQDWLRMQGSNPSLQSPFFYPELFISVGKFLSDIYVAVLYEGNVLVGFLPFRKDQANQEAKRIPFCNYQAIISSPGQHWDMNEIISKMKINKWSFDALVNFENTGPIKGHLKPSHSFRIDLSKGLEEYWSSIEAKKVELKSLIVKRRSLERNVGPVRLVVNCEDINVLDQLFQWITARYNHDPEWGKGAIEIIEHIYRIKDPVFQGILCALYAGDELLAANFSIKYHGYMGELHRAFNPDFTKYSGGILLLQELINEHKALKYKIYDLGPGEFKYKLDYSNDLLLINEGYFKVNTFKEQLKSINWLYQGLLPLARFKGKIKTRLSNIK